MVELAELSMKKGNYDINDVRTELKEIRTHKLRELPVIKGEDAKRFIKRSKENSESIKEALKEVKEIQKGERPKRSWRTMMEEVRSNLEESEGSMVNNVWIVMDTGNEVGSASVKGVFEYETDAKMFLANYVLENDVDTYNIELFEMDINNGGKI